MTNPIFNLLKGDVYAGISGIDFDFESLDLGDGILLSKTSAHMLAPYMVVFDPDQTRGRGSLDVDVLDKSAVRDSDGSKWVNVTDKTELIPAQSEYAIVAQLNFPAGLLSVMERIVFY